MSHINESDYNTFGPNTSSGLSILTRRPSFQDFSSNNNKTEPSTIAVSNKETPYLEITEQPQSHHKFRYKSEMKNSHGWICGKSHNKTKGISKYPQVKLWNFRGKAIINCSLVQFKNNEEHPHCLYVNDKGIENREDGYSLELTQDGSGEVRFAGMCIIRMTLEEVITQLMHNNNFEDLSADANIELRKQCEIDAKKINMNVVLLKFGAYDAKTGVPLCEPVFSEPIHNLKSPETNKLKICKLSKSCSRAKGKEEIIMLTEKVTKENIKIRFFELSPDGRELWSDNGHFHEFEVHHQCAITFRTPQYKDLNITKKVKVKIELVRNSSTSQGSEKSAALDFEYFPEPKNAHKRSQLTYAGLRAFRYKPYDNDVEKELFTVRKNEKGDQTDIHSNRPLYVNNTVCLPDTGTDMNGIDRTQLKSIYYHLSDNILQPIGSSFAVTSTDSGHGVHEFGISSNGNGNDSRLQPINLQHTEQHVTRAPRDYVLSSAGSSAISIPTSRQDPQLSQNNSGIQISKNEAFFILNEHFGDDFIEKYLGDKSM